MLNITAKYRDLPGSNLPGSNLPGRHAGMALVSNGVAGPHPPAPTDGIRNPGRRSRPPAGWHGVDWACELVGTSILVFVGLSAVVMDFGKGSPIASTVPSHSARLLLTGLVFAGSGALVAISPIGRRSGAHLNPSITLAFWCRRHLSLGDLAGYVTSQFLGAVAGTEALRAVWGSRAVSVRFGATLPGHGLQPWQAMLVEAAMTALLVVAIFAFVSSERTARWTPLAVWIVVAILVWQGAPYTGTSLNSARSFGPAFVAEYWNDYWIYLAGPLTGAVVAAALWAFVPRATLTAKLFHDVRYQSVLASELPVKQ